MAISIGSYWERIPSRLGIAIMTLFSTAAMYMLRANMSMNLLAMVEPTWKTPIGNDTETVVEDFGPRYAWSAFEQSLVLGGYFYGSAAGLIPFGFLLDKFGHVRWAMGVSFALVGCLHLLGPTLAAQSVSALIASRIVGGAAQGCLFPALHKLFAAWCPPNELGRFTALLTGGTLGTTVTWWLSGVLIERHGWPASFYVTGSLMLVFAAAWLWTVYDTPAEHPRIRAAEREYIERETVMVCGQRKNRSWPPVGRMLTSVPVWAFVLLQFGNLWGVFFVLTAAPKFINTVLNFQIASTGFLATLPYICRSPMAVLAGYGCDYLRRNETMSLFNIRRFFTVFSHIIPGLFLIAVPFVQFNPYICIAFISLSYGFNGCVTQSAISVVHDFVPNYVPSTFALANAIGSTSGFISPLLIAWLTSEKNSIEEWRNVFYVGAAVYIIPAVIFMFFGTSTVLSWNSPNDEHEKKDEDRVIE